MQGRMRAQIRLVTAPREVLIQLAGASIILVVLVVLGSGWR